MKDESIMDSSFILHPSSFRRGSSHVSHHETLLPGPVRGGAGDCPLGGAGASAAPAPPGTPGGLATANRLAATADRGASGRAADELVAAIRQERTGAG